MQEKTEFLDAAKLPPIHISLFRNELLLTSLTLSKVNCTIGSSEHCDLIIADPDVHPQHLLIRYQGGEYTINEHRSARGLLINGQLLHCAVLRSGDVLSLGVYSIVITCGDLPNASTTAQSNEKTTVHNPETYQQSVSSEKTEIAFNPQTPDRTQIIDKPAPTISPPIKQTVFAPAFDAPLPFNRAADSFHPGTINPDRTQVMPKRDADRLDDFEKKPIDNENIDNDQNIVISENGRLGTGLGGRTDVPSDDFLETQALSSLDGSPEVEADPEQMNLSLAVPLYDDDDEKVPAWEEPFDLLEILIRKRDLTGDAIGNLWLRPQIITCLGDLIISIINLDEKSSFPENDDIKSILYLPESIAAKNFKFIQAINNEYFFFFFDGIEGKYIGPNGENALVQLMTKKNLVYETGKHKVYAVRLKATDTVRFTHGPLHYFIHFQGHSQPEIESENWFKSLPLIPLILSVLLNLAFVPLFQGLTSGQPIQHSEEMKPIVLNLFPFQPVKEELLGFFPVQVKKQHIEETEPEAPPEPELVSPPSRQKKFKKSSGQPEEGKPLKRIETVKPVKVPAPIIPKKVSKKAEREEKSEVDGDDEITERTPPPKQTAPSLPPPVRPVEERLTFDSDPELDSLLTKPRSTEAESAQGKTEREKERNSSNKRQTNKSSTLRKGSLSIKILSGGSSGGDEFGGLLSELTNASGSPGPSIDIDEIDKVIDSNQQDIYSCIVQNERDLDSQGGKVTVTFEIQDNGRTSRQKMLKPKHKARMFNCIKRVIKQMRFNKLSSGTRLEVKKTFTMDR